MKQTRGQLNQAMYDIQQDITAVRQQWTHGMRSIHNNKKTPYEEQLESQHEETRPELPFDDARDATLNDPPGLSAHASMAGSATKGIFSTIEMPLFKGNKPVFVRDAHSRRQVCGIDR